MLLDAFVGGLEVLREVFQFLVASVEFRENVGFE
jgi:hypothetical protein